MFPELKNQVEEHLGEKVDNLTLLSALQLAGSDVVSNWFTKMRDVTADEFVKVVCYYMRMIKGEDRDEGATD